MVAVPKQRRRWHWWDYAVAMVALLVSGFAASCFCCGIFTNWWMGSDEGSSPVGLTEARRANPSRLTRGSFPADGPAPVPPADIARLVRYSSPAGQLAAYITPDPGDRKRRPAVLWAHGGFGGIGEAEWAVDQEAAPFREAGLVVMSASWRGENDNPGQYEMFYGEVDDALAAIDYLAQLPYVDPNRIYMVGHSTGGTLTLLTAAANSTKLRGAFSFGGVADLWDILKTGALPYPETPFNSRSRQERRLRSAIDYVEHLRTPTWYFEGNDSPSFLNGPLRMEQRARAAGAPFEVHVVAGGDHFNIVQPIGKLIAAKILSDQGPKCRISFTSNEVAQAFASR